MSLRRGHRFKGLCSDDSGIVTSICVEKLACSVSIDGHILEVPLRHLRAAGADEAEDDEPEAAKSPRTPWRRWRGLDSDSEDGQFAAPQASVPPASTALPDPSCEGKTEIIVPNMCRGRARPEQPEVLRSRLSLASWASSPRSLQSPRSPASSPSRSTCHSPLRGGLVRVVEGRGLQCSPPRALRRSGYKLPAPLRTNSPEREAPRCGSPLQALLRQARSVSPSHSPPQGQLRDLMLPELLDGVKLGVTFSATLEVLGVADPRATLCGWRVGDRLLRINGCPVDNEASFKAELARAVSQRPIIFSVLSVMAEESRWMWPVLSPQAAVSTASPIAAIWSPESRAQERRMSAPTVAASSPGVAAQHFVATRVPVNDVSWPYSHCHQTMVRQCWSPPRRGLSPPGNLLGCLPGLPRLDAWPAP